MLRIAINGISGRMGRELVSSITQNPNLKLIGGIDPVSDSPIEGVKVSHNADKILPDADVVIDFSLRDGAMQILRDCQKRHKALVTGTTGLSEDQLKKFKAAGKTIPIVQAFNYSVGINLMLKLVAMGAQVLKDKCDVEIIETHHRRKKDAPSGTALILANRIAEELHLSDKKDLKYGRFGKDVPRGKEIGVHSLRGGSVIGEHTVSFFGENENLSIAHQALNRKIFVDGALLAAQWIVTKKNGLYSMQDVLNF
jgi:4-hydroxy-tetrahydrodipicolinate reductase